MVIIILVRSKSSYLHKRIDSLFLKFSLNWKCWAAKLFCKCVYKTCSQYIYKIEPLRIDIYPKSLSDEWMYYSNTNKIYLTKITSLASFQLIARFENHPPKVNPSSIFLAVTGAQEFCLLSFAHARKFCTNVDSLKLYNVVRVAFRSKSHSDVMTLYEPTGRRGVRPLVSFL